MNNLAILQARMGSTRLPGKVLKEVMGRPLLSYQIERIRRARTIDHLIIATTGQAADDAVAEWAAANNVEAFRGSENDVLDRFYQAALPHQPTIITRLTGDCPLTDPQIIDDAVSLFRNARADYASNGEGVLFPDGLDVEVTSWNALASAWENAQLVSEREHVTPYIRKLCSEGILKRVTLNAPADFGHLRWTVDEPLDYEVVKAVLEALHPVNPMFGWMDVLAFVTKHPNLIEANSAIVRNEGYLKSLDKDHKS